ncbi:MAG: galactose-1-phosphate uridylyltransferase [Chloroflexi bacterium]|nr:galactose-1-phosphate uridylyltransferase [Chloroflexota bacterium]MCL5074712.1 galactose-1-phosphate uridylyltransferase [Chloroflexota bacterium]
MPQLRQDPIAGYWVVIATERAKRPHTFTQAPKEHTKPGRECPFCEGNERMTPAEVIAYRKPGSTPDSPGWYLRVVPNLYPAFGPAEGSLYPHQVGMYAVMQALGVHEVIIDGPDHHNDLGSLSVEQVATVVKAYVERYLAHKDNPIIKYILIIVNHGQEAGASREHPHSQLFGTPLVPAMIEQELAGTKLYQQKTGRCVYCAMLEEELQLGDRLIYENGSFVAFAPYASRVPFEMWILPRHHSSHFEVINEMQRYLFAESLHAVLGKLQQGLNDPPFNLYIHTTPCHDEAGGVYHWHVEILPKLSIAAGFELGSGIMINTATPESAAEFLCSIPI